MMRFFYFILFFTLRITTRVYFRKRKTHNAPMEFYGRTIYVSNHAASFMDPLLVASFRLPIVFFMTRSDIFTPLLKPVLWASHMLPIYRQLDGDDTKGKNEAVFKTCSRILSFGRNLLIFGEGFTDDVFIRRLKPVKKGAIRIGFITLEDIKWKKKVYIAAVGCNYSDPNYMRSDILISTSEKICLNDYKEAFEQNPNKVITELTKKLEGMMREQITHVADKEWAPFHENVMKLTRKGMNAINFDRSLSLKSRWSYSKKLANWMNLQDLSENEKLVSLKKDLEGYFALLKRFKIEENYVFDFQSKNKGNRLKETLYLSFLWPFAIMGFIHCFLPYILVKRFTEKSFKRPVFWSSVKMLLGKVAIGIFNIPVIFILHRFVIDNYWICFAYYFFAIPIVGLTAYLYVRNLQAFKTKGVLQKMDLTKFFTKRNELLVKIKESIPVA